MSLRRSYTLIAPFYDVFLAAATRAPRRRSLGHLAAAPPLDVLVGGVGTGLDLPHLPPQHRYVGIDLTPAMLRRAVVRRGGLDFAAVHGDVQALPFAAAAFDAAVLHLILAVVADPRRCLAEAARVVKPGGTILIFDKFLRPGESGAWKRLLNPLSRRIATRLDVVFEELLAATPELACRHDEASLAAGWFRLIRLEKRSRPAP